MRSAWIPAAVGVTTSLLAACATDDPDVTAGAGQAHDDVVHVHDLLIRDDDTVLVATHLGLRRIDGDVLTPVSDDLHDLMAAVLDGETILASGHPDLRDDTLRVDDRPPLLGVVESSDGDTWSPRSLLGEADFHRLLFVDDVLYGANSSDDSVWVSDDAGRTWAPRQGVVQLVAMAVDPVDADRMIGVDLDRGLVRSDDGGDSWTDTGGPELVDLEWVDDGAFGLDGDGDVYRFDEGTWTRVGDLADVAALGTRGDELFALRLPATVLRSTDGGTTWKDFP